MPVSFSQSIISNLTLQQSLYVNSLYAYSGTTITLNNTINIPSLTASECVVTDINKNLTSLQYSTTSSQNTISQRDSFGNINTAVFMSMNTLGSAGIYGFVLNCSSSNAYISLNSKPIFIPFFNFIISNWIESFIKFSSNIFNKF